VKAKYLRLLLIFPVIALILCGCDEAPEQPAGSITAAELLSNPVYDTTIEVYGQVSGLGVFECPCFALKSDEGRIYVWYDMMVEEGGGANPMTRPSIDVGEIDNEDWIVAIGELKYLENRKKQENFWLEDYQIIKR
jgi:hypothetical protein